MRVYMYVHVVLYEHLVCASYCDNSVPFELHELLIQCTMYMYKRCVITIKIHTCTYVNVCTKVHIHLVSQLRVRIIYYSIILVHVLNDTLYIL